MTIVLFGATSLINGKTPAVLSSISANVNTVKRKIKSWESYFKTAALVCTLNKVTVLPYIYKNN